MNDVALVAQPRMMGVKRLDLSLVLFICDGLVWAFVAHALTAAA